MTTSKPATEPTVTINDLPLKPRQRRDLTVLLEGYTAIKSSISAMERDAKDMQASIRAVVGNLGVDRFTADTDSGKVSVAYYPQVKEAIDRMELIRLGVEPATVDAATRRTEFFVLKVTSLK